jgi:hypothetical protein
VEALLADAAGRTPLHEVARRRCMQDFMGFLHLGWESATYEDDGLAKPLGELSPLWAAVAQVREGEGVHGEEDAGRLRRSGCCLDAACCTSCLPACLPTCSPLPVCASGG